MTKHTRIPEPGLTQVVTHQYTDGSTLSVCDRHADDVPNYTARGHSYSGVSHGRHRGTCDLCMREYRARDHHE